MRRRRKKLACIASFLLAVLVSVQAAAVSGWEMFAADGKQAPIGEIQTFIDGLSGITVVNMQVSYAPVEGQGKIPNTLVDKKSYDQLSGELKKLKISAQTAAEAGNESDFTLNVTTQKATVSFCQQGKNMRITGSLGTAVFGVSHDITDAVTAVTGVADVLQSLGRDVSREDVARLYKSQLDEAGRLIGYNGTINLIDRNNPAALAVPYSTVDTAQIYDGDEYYVRVTGKNDIIRLCNLVNEIQPSSLPEREKASRKSYDGLRLEFRLRDGSKHEYQMDARSDNLLVDGERISDGKITRLFDAVLADAYHRYPRRAAWLGYMNANRIVSAVVIDGTGSYTYTTQGYTKKILEIAADLKAIAVGSCTAYRGGKLPEAVRSATPTEKITLTFDGGAIYHVDKYPGNYMTVTWVDQDDAYLYRMV